MAQPLRPKSVRLEATSNCQLRCRSCPTATGETKPVLLRGYLKLDDFKTFLERNPFVTHVELSNYGEAFLHPQLLQILECAHEKNVALTIDNGANLNNARSEVLEGLVKYQLRSMSVSIDGASQETYVQYRVGGDFDAVIANVKTINEHKRRYRSQYPLLQWQFIAFGHNQHEIDKARRMASELGMRFWVKLAWGDSSPVTNYELVARSSGMNAASREEFEKKYGHDYMQGICHNLWDSPQINWDGKMLGCARNFWGEFGTNAFKDGLMESVNSEQMNYARLMLLGLRPPRADIPCTSCVIYQGMHRRQRWLARPGIAPPPPSARAGAPRVVALPVADSMDYRGRAI
jgi:MoaA/NifB/PqqE/SkfB family radical SAM enzyme